MRTSPAKDGDGLHPVSLGKLVLQEEGPVPATPAGIQAMFVHYGIDIAGKHVVIVGRGLTVGRPLGLLLTRRWQLVSTARRCCAGSTTSSCS